MAVITVTDNFFSGFAEIDPKAPKGIKLRYCYANNTAECFESSASNNLDVFLDVSAFKAMPNSLILSLKGDEIRTDDDDLILSVQKALDKKGDEEWRIQSGNYIGNIQYQKHEIEIKSRFSDSFLKRMLSVANNVYLSDSLGQQASKMNAEVILHYLFVQKLEKAFLLGFPKTYQMQHHHAANVKGKVNIRGLINKDMPYKGKLSSYRRERIVDEAIAVVLSKALSIVQKRNSTLVQNVRHVYNALRQLDLPNFKRESLKKAKSSKALNNPLFVPFKEILNLSELIINDDTLRSSKDTKNQSFGFLINVAELFEIYVRTLLQNKFSDWDVNSPSIDVYNGKFYSRKIIPDIVMKRDDQVLVFDTKYKRMNYKSTKEDRYGMGDVDRNDFFQIHTYLAYYQSLANTKVLGGGLLYPLSLEYSEDNCFSNALFEDKGLVFAVDGIFVPQDECDGFEADKDKAEKKVGIEEFEMEAAEQSFLNRIERIISS